MNSHPKSIVKRIFTWALYIIVTILTFGAGHYYGRLAERKYNANYNVTVLTHTYELLESNDLERVKGRLRFMIFENVMTCDQQFGSPIATNPVSTQLWTHARDITRQELTNVFPISRKILTDEVNNSMKTNRIAKTNPVTNP